MKNKLLLLGVFTLMAAIATLMLRPIQQDPAFHGFADERTIVGVPNFLNVISNLPFLLVGIIGLGKLRFSTAPAHINRMYGVLFVGILLVAFGSAYYHYSPDNNSLVYDRGPMTVVFMSFLAAVIAAWIDVGAGSKLLLPLLLLGIGSVFYWHYTEMKGTGDLRLYGFVQFFPMVLIPSIFLLFKDPVKNKGLRLLIGVITWYLVAKVLETFDGNIFKATHFISGHSLKHIAAAIATWYIVEFFEKKYVVQSD